MLGEPPDTEDFRNQFDWPDAVVRVPFDAPRISDVIEELDADPERCERVRRDSVVHALRKHDWAYRLLRILDAAAIPTPEALLRREAQLRSAADRALTRGLASPR
jgi:hypothetical protein